MSPMTRHTLGAQFVGVIMFASLCAPLGASTSLAQEVDTPAASPLVPAVDGGKPTKTRPKKAATKAEDPPPKATAPTTHAEPDEEEPATEQGVSILLFSLLFVVAILLLLGERLRRWLASNHVLHRLMTIMMGVLYLVGLGLLIGLLYQAVPGDPRWVIGLVLVIVAVAVWSVRDLIADVIAGIILTTERRVKKGMWVSGDNFQGTVEGRSLRATWLRDGQGQRLTVPNRAMVGSPIVYDSGWDTEHEVVVRLGGYDDATRIRQALNDAVLSSPWALAGATPVVLRDPADPEVWRVRSKLLEPRFSVQFAGELLERVEDLLRHEPDPDELRETVPEEPPIDEPDRS